MQFRERRRLNEWELYELVSAGGGGLGQLLVDAGLMAAPLTLSRAQVSGARSTGLGTDDLTWAEYNADVPRFHSAAQRLLVEGQRTNQIRNPRAEGAAPNTLPTFWTISAPLGGITGTVVGLASYAGLTGLEVEYTGTATANTAPFCFFETNTGVVAAPGQVWTASVFQRVSSGTPPNGTTPQIRIIERDSGGSALVNHNTAAPAPSTTLQRIVGTSGVFGASAARVNSALSVAFLSGTTADCRVQFLWPQLGPVTFASTPILPPVGTTAASTRGADIVTASAASLGIPASGACTILWSGRITQNAPAGVDQVIAAISDGSADNVLAVMNAGGGATIVPHRVTATVGSSGSSAGSMTAGTVFRAGMTCSDGRVAVSFNGNAATAVTGGPTSGLTLLSLGSLPGGLSSMFGETGYLRVIPGAVPDATLAALVAAMPT